MDLNMLLYIAFIMYIMIMVFSYFFRVKWLLMISGLLWFIPVFEISNVWVTLVSVIMILAHFILGFIDSESGGFE